MLSTVSCMQLKSASLYIKGVMHKHFYQTLLKYLTVPTISWKQRNYGMNYNFLYFCFLILLKKSRKQKQTHLTVGSKELFLVYLKGLFWDPFFLIYTYTAFYADDSTPFTFFSVLQKILLTLTNKCNKMFKWFQNKLKKELNRQVVMLPVVLNLIIMHNNSVKRQVKNTSNLTSD